LAGATGVFMLK